ncbi:UNKNOWN [Stylonychia lemnae]|uniref:Uncharacterized protein n=1 Tax=Stylonychia lemnae TaxID=5949 RepID=A0A077ZRE9_STYLE|nr:UNKNOWN [Stylonychia lemnae]|eukprot:CDW72029.1 UNKNOWN [Stylonychia lemnae]
MLTKIKDPMSSHQKQQLYSFYNFTRFRKTKPTLNRLQNMILHQKQLYNLRQPKIHMPHFDNYFQKLKYQFMQGMIRRGNYIKKEILLLASSRILQFLSLIPICYLSYNVGRQAYISYLSYQYPGYYTKPATPIKDKFKRYVATLVGNTLRDPQVEKEGLNFLSKLFMEPQTHEAGVYLLKNVLNDPRFVEEGKIFGIDLISSILRSKQCEQDFIKIVMTTLQQEKVKKETVELLRYIVKQSESEEILAIYFKTVFLRDDMLQGVSKLLAKSAVDALDQPQIKDKFGNFVLQVAENPIVRTKLYQNYLIKPAKKFFSFGLLSGNSGEEQQPQSQENKQQNS